MEAVCEIVGCCDKSIRSHIWLENWQFCVVSLVTLQIGTFEHLATQNTMLQNPYFFCLFSSKILYISQLCQQYIVIAYLFNNFLQNHMNNNMEKTLSQMWDLMDLSQQHTFSQTASIWVKISYLTIRKADFWFGVFWNTSMDTSCSTEWPLTSCYLCPALPVLSASLGVCSVATPSRTSATSSTPPGYHLPTFYSTGRFFLTSLPKKVRVWNWVRY